MHINIIEMSNSSINNERTFIYWLRDKFKKKKIINKDDIGIYHYIWTCDTLNEDSHGLKYDIYAKIKAIESYENLIEIELVDIKINDSASNDIQNIIKNNFPKYVNPKYVQWQLKQS